MYKLLIVDDEELVRRGIKSLVDFKKIGIDEILESSNGQEALEVFKKNSPDIVLADINMPKIDGITLAEEIKKINRATKIAIITGYDYFDYALSAIKIGVDDYVLKPFSKDDITALLIKLIDKIGDEENQKKVNQLVDEILKNDNFDDENIYKKKIATVIEKNLSNSKFSLKFLADSLGFSSGYLSALFKRLFGITFQDYVIAKRLERAKLLLLTTDMKNYEIAEVIGFDDVNYFSTRFKKNFGISPKHYREEVINE